MDNTILDNTILDQSYDWNHISDSCTEFIHNFEELISMNAPMSKLEDIISMYLEASEYRSKDWKLGFRQALFLVLNEVDYERFVRVINKNELG